MDDLTCSGLVVASISIRVLVSGVILFASFMCCLSPLLSRVFFAFL